MVLADIRAWQELARQELLPKKVEAILFVSKFPKTETFVSRGYSGASVALILDLSYDRQDRHGRLRS
ncbi:hypothetical protein ACFX13_023481 [Malus domestica]